MSSNYVGQIVADQFRVDAFISAGGMGSVFRVWDLERNVPLAMKVLHADLAEDQVIFERFKREARALRKLKHPNIVPFYGLYLDPSLMFLMQCFSDGPTLNLVLAQVAGALLPVRDIICIIKSLCSAVGFAHTNAIVHCDIKPANILIDQGRQVFLGDFGIARHADSTTTALPGMGTAAYMAPEQIVANMVTKETDIYALGVLLFELFTGRRPFRGSETGTEESGATVNERIRYAHVNLPPPDPRLIIPNIGAHLSAIILIALDKNPANRFSSCQDLLSALCNAYNITPEQIPDRLSAGYTGPPQVIYPDTVHDPKLPKAKPANKLVYMVAGGAVIVILLMIFLTAQGVFDRSKTELLSREYATLTSVANKATQPVVLLQATVTKQPTKTATRVKLTSTSTPYPEYGSCSDGIPHRVQVGDTAKVCTTEDRLILRDNPAADGQEIFRMYPGVKMVIIDGPKCGSQHTWWHVRVKAGSWVWDGSDFATNMDVEGWVREGGFDTDRYFICPDN